MFTSEFGEIDDSFYSTMESMYEGALECIKGNDELKDIFIDRCSKIIKDVSDIDGEFQDSLKKIFDKVFNVKNS
ncbi:MAG: hypothetical protein HQK92_10760 [Nitrospirae bacterium]|nr:hypothetical protein [Nitrospirota bacterium]